MIRNDATSGPGSSSPAPGRRQVVRVPARWRLAAAIVAVAGGLRAAPTAAPQPLVWDAMAKSYQAKPGDDRAEIAFEATNTGSAEVVVERVEPSCGCTIAELPSHPWRLAPGASGTLRLKIDLIGKTGELQKSAVVTSTVGVQMLQVTLSVPPMSDADRTANQRLARHDRQAVFRGDCARCHAAPASGKEGAELFRAACAICHASANRASSVPLLARAKTHRDAAYWHGLIAEGRPDTMMPAFSEVRGGPLGDRQIASLVDFLLQNFPADPPAADDGPAP